jgi:hypothetical protein
MVAGASNNRSLHSSAPVAAAGTGVAKAEEKGIIETYGVLPFAAFGFAALVGKEAFILNEEFMLAVNTCSFIFTAYVATGDSFAKLVDEHNAAANAKFTKSVDCVLTAVNTYKESVQSKFDEVEVMKEFIAEQHQAAEAMVAYSNAKVRHAAYNEMMAKLTGIKAREDAEAAEQFTQLVDETVGGIRSAYEGEGGAQLKAQALNYAIENIGKVPKDDPVSKLFIKTVSEGEKSA